MNELNIEVAEERMYADLATQLEEKSKKELIMLLLDCHQGLSAMTEMLGLCEDKLQQAKGQYRPGRSVGGITLPY